MNCQTITSSIILYIESRVREQLPDEAIARACSLSAAHMRDIFRRQTGISLGAYVRHRRIAYAAFDLLHTKDCILDIAARYGFDNPDTFTRAFRRETGCTPSEFRRVRPPMGTTSLCGGAFGICIAQEKLNTEEQI